MSESPMFQSWLYSTIFSSDKHTTLKLLLSRPILAAFHFGYSNSILRIINAFFSAKQLSELEQTCQIYLHINSQFFS